MGGSLVATLGGLGLKACPLLLLQEVEDLLGARKRAHGLSIALAGRQACVADRLWVEGRQMWVLLGIQSSSDVAAILGDELLLSYLALAGGLFLLGLLQLTDYGLHLLLQSADFAGLLVLQGLLRGLTAISQSTKAPAKKVFSSDTAETRNSFEGFEFATCAKVWTCFLGRALLLQFLLEGNHAGLLFLPLASSLTDLEGLVGTTLALLLLLRVAWGRARRGSLRRLLGALRGLGLLRLGFLRGFLHRQFHRCRHRGGRRRRRGFHRRLARR